MLLTGSEILLHLAVLCLKSPTKQKNSAHNKLHVLTAIKILLDVALFTVEAPIYQKQLSPHSLDVIDR